MTGQVSWGLSIANFTFLVGVAAAAVMLVIPVYIYRNRELHDLVIFAQLLAGSLDSPEVNWPERTSMNRSDDPPTTSRVRGVFPMSLRSDSP